MDQRSGPGSPESTHTKTKMPTKTAAARGFKILTTSHSGFELIVEERSFSSFRADEWDKFAAACGESFLGSWGVVKARRFFGRVRLFDFVLTGGSGPRQKVGQCAVHVGRRKVTFLDKIQLLPSHRHLNRRCFDFVMRQFGDVAYKYGSRWNDEDEFDFERMSRFDVDSTIFHVDLIEFRDWPKLQLPPRRQREHPPGLQEGERGRSNRENGLRP